MQDNTNSSRTNRTIYILLSIGFTAGILGGLLGIGGGAFVVPALVFFLGFDQHRAHGTSLAIVIVLSLAGVCVYHFLGANVDILFALGIAGGGLIGAMLGGNVVQKIRNSALRRMFSLFLMASGVKMAYDGSRMRKAVHAAGQRGQGAFALEGITLAVGTGIATGFLSAILGVGGGIIMVPVLTMLLRFAQADAQGTSLAAMLPIAVAGMLKHKKLGNVDVRVAKWIATGAFAGAIIGALFAHLLHASTLKLAFGVFLIVMAALMAAKKK